MYKQYIGHYCNFVKDQSSHLMYLNIMHKITNLWKFELNIGRRSCDQ